MKKIILLTIIAFSASFVNAQWQQTNYSFGGYIFTNCMATNGTDVYVSNDSSGIYRTTDNGNTWSTVNNGLPINPNVQALAISGTNIFAGLSYYGLYLSTNDGNSWTHLTNGLPTGFFSPSAFAISRSNIFVGTGIRSSTASQNGIYLSTNNGSNWIAVNNGLPANDNITTLAISGTNIFAGTESHGIFLSTNNGSNWIAANGTLFSTNTIESLAIKNSNVFVTSSSSSQGGIYLSANNGSSWSTANNGISFAQYCTFYAIAINSSNVFTAGLSLMSGSNVVYLSNNDGSNWTNFSNGLPAWSGNNTIKSLVVNNLNVFAGTQDGKVWSRALSKITGIEKNNTSENIVIFPNPAQNEITIQNPIATTNSLISIRNIQGQELIKENINQNSISKIDISNLDNGVYFIELKNEKGNYISKFVIQK